MFPKIIILSLLTSFVFGDICETYNFENDFDNLFSSTFGMCSTIEALGIWELGNYSAINVEPPDPLSSKFISPANTMSCTSSFTFPMSVGSHFEIHVYMEPATMMDQVNIFVNQFNEIGDDTQVGTITLVPILLPDFEPGWHTRSATLSGTGTYQGYVTIIGQAAEGSVLLIDSFKYIPASYSEADRDECVIYSDETEDNISEGSGEEEISTEDGSGSGDDSENTSDENNSNVDESNSNEEEENNTNESQENSNETDENNSDSENSVSNESQIEEESNEDDSNVEENISDESEDNDTNESEGDGDNTEEDENTGEANTEEEVSAGEEEDRNDYTAEESESDENDSQEIETEESDQESEEIDGIEEIDTNETSEIDESDTEEDTEGTEDIDTNETSEIDESDTEENTEGTEDIDTNETSEIDESDTEEDTEGTEDIDTSETSEIDETNTEDNTEGPIDPIVTSSEETQGPVIENPSEDYSFWNVFTITMTATIVFIILVYISYCCYECGKRRAQDRAPLIFDDIEVPPTIVVPRVTRVYNEPSPLHSFDR